MEEGQQEGSLSKSHILFKNFRNHNLSLILYLTEKLF